MIKVKKFNKTLKRMAEIATGDTFKIETERDWYTNDNDWDLWKFLRLNEYGDYELIFSIETGGSISFVSIDSLKPELINILPSLSSLVKYRIV